MAEQGYVLAQKSIRQLHLLPLILMLSVLSSGVFLVLASVAGSVGRTLPLSETQIFLHGYEAFKPGQPVDVFTEHGCIYDQNDKFCKYRMVISQPTASCLNQFNPLVLAQNVCREIVYTLYPQTEPFDLIKVVAVNEQIRTVEFYSKSLSADTLFHQWSDPDNINSFRDGSAFHLVWHHQDYTATAIVSHHERIARLITFYDSADHTVSNAP